MIGRGDLNPLESRVLKEFESYDSIKVGLRRGLNLVNTILILLAIIWIIEVGLLKKKINQ